MKSFRPSFGMDGDNNGSFKAIIAMLLCCYYFSQCIADPSGELCPEVDGNSESCACRTSEGVIDLSALPYRNGTPRFSTIADSKHYYYDFNPCQAFNSEGGCINIHICQGANFDSSAHYSIADQGTEEIWVGRDGKPYLYYTGPGNSDMPLFKVAEKKDTNQLEILFFDYGLVFIRNNDLETEVKVFLNCDRSLSTGEEKLTTTGDTITRLTYLFDLYSCHACPGGCDYIYSRSKAGVFGFTLILLVVLGIITYFVIGAIILKFHFGFSGCEILPHKDFWSDLPFLIQDGYYFFVGSFVHSMTPPKPKQGRMDYETQL